MFDGIDLVFVDDSDTAPERVMTIERIAHHTKPSNVVVIHDFETLAYQRASLSFKNRFAITGLLPNTGILWNDAPIIARNLTRLNRIIARHGRHVPSDDLEEWYTIFARVF